ncbi:MAG: hypothetical protein SAJ37_11280 [Oscillatoria sp. PMC 1068.18]|nr:hypothetical protein [Oscillatoria sp. PMC 1076.18]MEC4989321.1 hypothetical protein [Oscillatoria sp. PMC 1068.18]
MLNLDLIRYPQVDQEAKKEEERLLEILQVKAEVRLEGKFQGKLEMIPKLIDRMMSVEEISETLELEFKFLKKIIDLSLILSQDLTAFQAEVKKTFLLKQYLILQEKTKIKLLKYFLTLSAIMEKNFVCNFLYTQ